MEKDMHTSPWLADKPNKGDFDEESGQIFSFNYP